MFADSVPKTGWFCTMSVPRTEHAGQTRLWTPSVQLTYPYHRCVSDTGLASGLKYYVGYPWGISSSYNDSWYTLLPAVGEPVSVPKIDEPTDEDVERFHTLYVESLVKVFNSNKLKYGLREVDCLVLD